MPRRPNVRFRVVFLLFFITPAAAAQESREAATAEEAVNVSVGWMVLVRTVGGGEFQGRVLSTAEDRIELIDGEGRIISIHRPAIVAAARIGEDGEDRPEKDLFFRDAASNRLIVMPTAFAIEKGELHITNQEVVVVTMSYGLTDRVSVWGGISIPGALANVRYAFSPGGRVAASIGAFTGVTWTDPHTNALLLPYLLTSFGTPDRNTTLAAALPILKAGEEDPRVTGVLAAVGWKTIVSRTASVIVETWIYYDGDRGRWEKVAVAAVPAVAFRIAGGRFSWDIGAFLPTEFASLDTGYAFTGLTSDAFIPLPIISLTYRLR